MPIVAKVCEKTLLFSVVPFLYILMLYATGLKLSNGIVVSLKVRSVLKSLERFQVDPVP